MRQTTGIIRNFPHINPIGNMWSFLKEIGMRIETVSLYLFLYFYTRGVFVSGKTPLLTWMISRLIFNMLIELAVFLMSGGFITAAL